MLTLEQLLRATPIITQKSSKSTAVLKAKIKRKADGTSMLEAIVQRKLNDRKPHPRHKCEIESINSKKPLLSQGHVKVSCDCLTGDTKVLTDEGWKTIYELAQPLQIGHHPIVYMVNGKPHYGSAPFYKGRSPVWELTLSNGETIKATRDHKFLTQVPSYSKTVGGETTYVKARSKWQPLKDLKVGSRIRREHYTPNRIELGSDFDEAFLVGTIMGDGTVQAGKEMPDLQICKRWPEITAVLNRTDAVKKVSKVSDRSSVVRVTFNHRAVEILKRYDYRNKEHAVYDTHEKMLGYLAGLIITDGRVYGKEVTVFGGEAYLRPLFEALLRYGYSAVRLYKDRVKGTETNYGLATKDMWALHIGSESLRHLYKAGVFIGDDQRKFVEKGAVKAKGQHRNYVTVTNIKYAGRQNVYDITVPGITRFVANSVIVHNCEAFTFWLEWVLHQRGAADIKHSNGEPPDIRNPGRVYFLCPHLTKLGLLVLHKKI